MSPTTPFDAGQMMAPLVYNQQFIKLFKHLSLNREDLVSLASMFIKREHPRNKILINSGEVWNKAFFIHNGMIRLFYIDSKGRESNKGFFGEGQLVWPVAPKARTKGSLFTISALENITVSVCLFTDLYAWLVTRGYWEKFALPFAELFAEQKFLREYEFLMKSATERFQAFCMEYPYLAHRIPDYHLASYLGVTNVSLSRIKAKLKDNEF